MLKYTVETENRQFSTLGGKLKDEQFGVLWNFDLTAKLQEKGEDFSTRYTILEVCNPKEAIRCFSLT